MMMYTNDFFIFSNNLLDRKTLDLYNRYGNYNSLFYVKSNKFENSLPEFQYNLLPNFTICEVLYNHINEFNLQYSSIFILLIDYKILRQKQFLFLLKI